MNCVHPIYVRKSHIFVRCGKCLPCIDNRVREWAVRLEYEFQKCLTAYFITLTYAENPEKLDKYDIQLFFKRLRSYVDRGMPDTYNGRKVSKIDSNKEIKYFTVGEYGKENNRGHWHILLFNYPFDVNDMDDILSFAWTSGFHHSGIVKTGSIYYTLDYMYKNLDKRCVRLFSKGLGKDYVNEKNINYHQTTLDGFIRVNQTKKPMPRYYAEKLYNQEQRKKIGREKLDWVLDQDVKHPLLKMEQLKKLENKVRYRQTKKS